MGLLAIVTACHDHLFGHFFVSWPTKPFGCHCLIASVSLLLQQKQLFHPLVKTMLIL